MSEIGLGVRPLPHGVRCFFHLTPFHQMSIGKQAQPTPKEAPD